MGIMIVFIMILLFCVVGVIVYFVSIYNGLIRLKKNIDKSGANIEVIQKQRHDELPKLIETCKGYMQHERGILENLTGLRSKWMNATTLPEKAKISDDISGALKTLFAVAENYPNLKANENFLQLQGRISGLENELADRREFYNDSATTYNIRIKSIPDVFVANMLHYEQTELFKALPEELKDVEVKFS